MDIFRIHEIYGSYIYFFSINVLVCRLIYCELSDIVKISLFFFTFGNEKNVEKIDSDGKIIGKKPYQNLTSQKIIRNLLNILSRKVKFLIFIQHN